MSAITSDDLVAVFQGIAAAIEVDKDRLCALDGVIGDADHGITMSLGCTAVCSALGALDPGRTDPSMIFNTAAKSFLNAVGASSGPLYATAFMRAGAAVKGRTVLDRDAMVAVLAAMAQGIRDRGKAGPGDKTMLDAWLPAAEAATAALAEDRDLLGCLNAAATAAIAGAESTRAMLAGKGRASRLGDRVIGHMDPGAASAATILTAINAVIGARLSAHR